MVAREWRSTLVTPLADDARDRLVPGPRKVAEIGGRCRSRRAQEGDGALDLGGEVERTVAAGQLAGLAQRDVGGLPDVSDPRRSPCVAARREGRRELGLDGDARQAAAHHVVHVAGEAQSLLRDGQGRLAGARVVELGDDAEQPQRALHREDQEQPQRQPVRRRRDAPVATSRSTGEATYSNHCTRWSRSPPALQVSDATTVADAGSRAGSGSSNRADPATAAAPTWAASEVRGSGARSG